MAAGRPALTMRLSQFARDDSYSNPTNTALGRANRQSTLRFAAALFQSRYAACFDGTIGGSAHLRVGGSLTLPPLTDPSQDAGRGERRRRMHRSRRLEHRLKG